MPMHNSARAAVEAQCYLNRKRQNISKEDLERVKAFAELYKPRAGSSSSTNDCSPSRPAKRARPSPLRQFSPSPSSSASRAYPSPSPSPPPSASPSASSYSCTTPSVSPPPRSTSFNFIRHQSLHEAHRTHRFSVISKVAQVVHQWVAAVLALLSAVSAWWTTTTAWFTFLFTATFGAICTIRTAPNSSKRAAPRVIAQLDPSLPPTTSASYRTGFLKVAGSGPHSRSITFTKRGLARAQAEGVSISGAPVLSWQVHGLCSSNALIRIDVSTAVHSGQALPSQRMLESFGYDVEAYETYVEQDAWDVKIAQCLTWTGRPSAFSAALNAALDLTLTELRIANCRIALDDLMAILYTCENLRSLKVFEIGNPHNRRRRLLPQDQYLPPTALQHPHGLHTLSLTSAVPLEDLLSRLRFPEMRHLHLRLLGGGNATKFAPDMLRYMNRTLQSFVLRTNAQRSTSHLRSILSEVSVFDVQIHATDTCDETR
ncbi:hypothetical protein BKA70DRAFT_224713 [Coprinopsis sp. MPI-PUGE-AT-0042]|nr:hypothetical protein BKA70DRAFT_224713 [Coprinopsis sp. MPI-PUGE-AT-0042]